MNGKIIKELRVEKGLTQKQLATELNTSQRNISKYERGDLDLNTEIIVQLCKFFQISADYLLGITDVLGATLPSSTVPQLTKEEKRLLENFRSMRSDLQTYFVTISETLTLTSETLSEKNKETNY